MSSATSSADKMWFLQFLRGVACLIIVYVHWLSFLRTPGVVNGIVYQSELPPYSEPSIVTTIAVAMNTSLPFDFREMFFGLGLFFLISGFIIPLSLEKSTKINYLIRRIARILPTAIACTVLTAIVIIIARFIDGNTVMPFSLKTVLSNALLIRDLKGAAYVDTAIWTLEVEVHFYLICFAISFFAGQKKAIVITALALIFLGVSILTAGTDPLLIAYNLQLKLIAMNGCFMVLMFIGMSLYNFHVGNWSVRKTAAVVVALLLINHYTLRNYYSADFAVMYVNHLYAVLIFLVFFLLGDRLPYSKVMDKIANISYPLYLLHGALGYVVFYAMYKSTSVVWLSVIVTCLLVYSLTLLVHFTIELPSTPMGKKAAAFVDRARARRFQRAA
ncbi:acyltransferase [Pseudomonas sp. H3(2019)]|uniref:acyltransferase family protein n=1 Tax=Pseudomonas sp. H3(2019) TaxID=2598724 RepID=UPI0015B637A6|nr:acyltransferase [Pseudomonas sp. H3(2019)]